MIDVAAMTPTSDRTVVWRRFVASAAAAATLGVASFAGHQYATVEDQVRVLTECTATTCRGKVPGKTAIPAGTYLIRDSWSPRFKKMMLEVVGVPGFQGIRIHSGNTADDTEGCLIPGLEATPTGVRYSVRAVTQLNADIRAKLKTGPVWIKITDEFGGVVQ